MKKIRDLRQAPAHKIENNVYDQHYFDKQIELSKELLDALILFRQILLTHPNIKASDFKINHKNEIIVIP